MSKGKQTIPNIVICIYVVVILLAYLIGIVEAVRKAFNLQIREILKHKNIEKMKTFSTIEEVIELLEKNSIGVDEYKEDSVLCGYELNTYTNGGVNQILFIDYRYTELNPKDAKTFIDLFNDRVNDIDIDDEIECNRQNDSYKNAFTLSESVEDFTNWKKELESIFNSNKKSPEQRQFEQVNDKFVSLISQLNEITELMPTKGQTKEDCQKTNIICLINRLEYGVNGIELSDFTPNEFSQDFKLSYS